MLVGNSGFEDTIFQFELCRSGSLNGALAGIHYKRAWTVQTGMLSNLLHFWLKDTGKKYLQHR